MVSNQLGVSTGAADVPAFLWDRHLQRPALRRFQERVRQEPGKARPADRWICYKQSRHTILRNRISNNHTHDCLDWHVRRASGFLSQRL